MQAKLIVSFDRLNEVEYLAKSSSIIAALTGNPNYPEPWATQVPTLQQLQAAFKV
ncbi:MAG: fibronectin type III domain-containing protein, partial [Methylococcales bacterium]